ncbi:hypothetical protein AAFF_G00341140 [Aldrovandia affinis]|uniref:Uncharacterized protein n=1 Tax=Aldrovandia affinis TaxID=143900 RepID=A0AAD7SKL6_9TELE|nr:hypothetical protein AAFF_G00341140 [Aldrovandia affinis]
MKRLQRDGDRVLISGGVQGEVGLCPVCSEKRRRRRRRPDESSDRARVSGSRLRSAVRSGVDPCRERTAAKEREPGWQNLRNSEPSVWSVHLRHARGGGSEDGRADAISQDRSASSGWVHSGPVRWCVLCTAAGVGCHAVSGDWPFFPGDRSVVERTSGRPGSGRARSLPVRRWLPTAVLALRGRRYVMRRRAGVDLRNGCAREMVSAAPPLSMATALSSRV